MQHVTAQVRLYISTHAAPMCPCAISWLKIIPKVMYLCMYESLYDCGERRSHQEEGDAQSSYHFYFDYKCILNIVNACMSERMYWLVLCC